MKRSELPVVNLTFEGPPVGAGVARSWDRAIGLDVEQIREIDLRYKFFMTPVTFEVEGTELIGGWSLTLVDFALGVSEAADRLRSRQDAAIGFTESADVIYLDRLNDVVRMRYLVSNRAEKLVVEAPAKDLVEAMSAFVESAYERLIAEFPGLAGHPLVQRIAQGAR